MHDTVDGRASEARRRRGLGRSLGSLVGRTKPHLYAADTAAVLVAGLGVTWAAPDVFGGLQLGPVAAAAGVAALLAGLVGLHRSRLVPSVREDLVALAVVALVAALTMALLTDAGWMRGPGWMWHTALLAAVVLAAEVCLRGAIHQVTLALRREGLLGQRVVIVDSGPEGSQLAETLLARRELGLIPVGMISCDSGRPARGLPLPLLGGLEDLQVAMRDLDVDDVIFALPDLGDADTVAIVRRCVRDDGQVFVMPRPPLGAETLPLTDLVQVQRSDLSPTLDLPARVAGLVASALALVVLIPVLLPAIVALRLEVGRGVFFRQTRISESGRPFTLFKLRTTRSAVFDAGATSWRIDNDTTVGPVGRLVRLTGIDELPQLLNVLRGEMRLASPWSARSDVVRDLSR